MFSYKNVTTNNADFNKNNTIHQLKGAAAWGVSFGIQYRFIKEWRKPLGELLTSIRRKNIV